MTVAKYLRLSSEDGDRRRGRKGESDSIGNQRDLLDAHIRRTPELAGARVLEFCDDGWSGKNFERPAVRELLSQVKRGQIQCVVVKDFSRFGRDYLTVGAYIFRVFPFLGVRFIAVNDGFDSARPADLDSLETSFKTLLYDLYSRDLSRKVRSAKRARARRGDFLSPFAPFGYAKDPENKNRLRADPRAAEIVRGIFQMAAEGRNTAQIAKTLNRRCVPTPMQYKRAAGCSRTVWTSIKEDNFWTENTVSLILRDERYTGKMIYGKKTRDRVGDQHVVRVRRSDQIVVEGSHEAIVSPALFEQARGNLRQYPAAGKPRREKAGLAGKVKCGVCGHAMGRTKAKAPCYLCRTPRVTDTWACPTGPTPEADVLDVLSADLRARAAAAAAFSGVWEEERRRARRGVDALRKDIAAHKERLEQMGGQITRLYESFATGEIGREDYIARKESAVKERETVSARLSELSAQLEDCRAGENPATSAAADGPLGAEEEALIGEILADVLKEIRVYPDGRFHIVWDVRDEYGAFLQKN